MSMPSFKAFLRLFVVSVLLGCTSCVKDVDLDQGRDLTLEPSVAISLVDFSFKYNWFFDEEGEPRVTEVRDTIPLEVLDQDLTGKLKSVDLYFNFSNTFNRRFYNSYSFYAPDETVVYEIDPIVVPERTSSEAAILDTIITVEGGDLEALKRARALGIILSIRDTTVSNGQLDVRSMAIYNFEFE